MNEFIRHKSSVFHKELQNKVPRDKDIGMEFVYFESFH